jgi:mannitol-1-phosphate/altronate dehydrogenase
MGDGPRMECVVFGAGALGLGFLGPELTTDCRITFLDIPAKADLLGPLHADGAYSFNETGLSMRAVRVEQVDGLAISEESRAAIDGLLDAADLVITAVGEPNLPMVAPTRAAAAVRRSPDRPLRILCAENGVEIARKLGAAVVATDAAAEGRFLVSDTVMGRMCKVVEDPQPPVVAPAPGLNWAVVAEPFFGIPVEKHVVAGMPRVPAALDPQTPARFSASEDVKMLSHNGLHAVISCIGHLRAIEHFDDLRAEPDIMELARRLLIDEAGAAILRKHAGAIGRTEYLNYADSILRRVTCPVLHDPIARGVRGVMRKLQPWERLIHSLRTVSEQGLEPEAYATGTAAAVLIAGRSGETQLDFRSVLVEHCGLDPDADGGLIALIEARREGLE